MSFQCRQESMSAYENDSCLHWNDFFCGAKKIFLDIMKRKSYEGRKLRSPCEHF